MVKFWKVQIKYISLSWSKKKNQPLPGGNQQALQLVQLLMLSESQVVSWKNISLLLWGDANEPENYKQFSLVK